MAGKKGRSGRKPGKLTAKKKMAVPLENKMQVTVLPPAPPAPAPVPVPHQIVEAQPAPGLLQGIKEKIKNLASPTATISSGSTEAESGGGSGSLPEFDVIADRLEEKYGASDAPGGSAEAGNASPPLSINPGVGHVVSPSTVESFLVMVLTGLEKTHGPQWHPSETDKAVLVPVYTAAIDEQAPRWFADSPNKAAWLCVLVTVLYIVSRSKSGGRLVEWGMSKISSLVSGMGASTKTESPA